MRLALTSKNRRRRTRIVQAILSGDKKQARKVTYQSMQEFWRDGARVASR